MMKTKSYPILFAAIISLCNFIYTVKAQDVPGLRDTLHSKILNETRDIRVILPDNYKPGSGVKYDVLYVLDAEDDARKILNIERLAESYQFIPPMIIVNILTIYYNDRDRDFTPSHIDTLPTSGGAKNFLSFLKDEVMPFIDKKYPTNGDNTLYGHSLGGLFTFYTLLNEPQLFRSYIITDPSLWWDNGYMNKMLDEKLNSTALSGKTIYVGSRDGDGMVQMRTDVMDRILKAKAPAGLHWESVHYPNETHFSLIYKTAYDGLKYTYSGYNPGNMEFHPMDGIVLKDKPFNLVFYNPLPAEPAIRYTIDGTVPTESSTKMAVKNTISGSATVNIKSFCFREKYDTMLSVHYKTGKVLPPIAKPKNIQAGGLHYSHYEGTWDKLPDFGKLKPSLSGIAGRNFRVANNIAKFPNPNNFALLIEGYVEIKEDGYYTFLLNSDDGSRLYLGDKLLIDYDGIHGRWDAKSYMVPLQKGFYPVRLEYFQNKYDLFLEIKYIPPGGASPVLIPFEQQYSGK